jgi:dipeptide/tripeptide permease
VQSGPPSAALAVPVLEARSLQMAIDVYREHGSSIGVLSSVMDVGHSVGPLVTGLVVGAVSFLAGFGLASVLLIVGAIVFVMEMRTPSP